MLIFIIIAIILVAIIWYTTHWQAMDLSEIYHDPPIYFGHRGARHKHPENTIAAYDSALKSGLKAIELDVLLTKDERLVCSHNYDLERETNGMGFIDEIDYINLEKIKTGHQFPQSQQQPIPLFTDVINFLPHDVLVNVEIKIKKAFDFKAAIKLVRLIKNEQIPQKVIVSSFNPFVVRLVKLLSKSTPTGYIYEDVKFFKGVYIARPDCLNPDGELITDQIIKFCRNRNMRINTWTINNIFARDQLIKKGIDGIITDNPSLAQTL